MWLMHRRAALLNVQYVLLILACLLASGEEDKAPAAVGSRSISACR